MTEEDIIDVTIVYALPDEDEPVRYTVEVDQKGLSELINFMDEKQNDLRDRIEEDA